MAASTAIIIIAKIKYLVFLEFIFINVVIDSPILNRAKLTRFIVFRLKIKLSIIKSLLNKQVIKFCTAFRKISSFYI